MAIKEKKWDEVGGRPINPDIVQSATISEPLEKELEVEPEEKLALVLDRYEGETWLDAAMRMAEKTNLKDEVKNAYDEYIKHNDSEEKAAWCACYDWDCLELLKL